MLPRLSLIITASSRLLAARLDLFLVTYDLDIRQYVKTFGGIPFVTG